MPFKWPDWRQRRRPFIAGTTVPAEIAALVPWRIGPRNRSSEVGRSVRRHRPPNPRRYRLKHTVSGTGSNAVVCR